MSVNTKSLAGTQAPRRRRTQDERSGEMRDRLVRATVESLIEDGYERTTTLRIAERAGVTRGALVHHFESKRDLVVAAMRYLLADHATRIQELAERVRAGKVDLDDFLDYLWNDYSGEFFFAWLENITESRHDEALRQSLIPLVREYHATLDSIWREFFRKSGLNDSQVDTFLNQTLCILRGMGLQTVLRPDDAYYQGLLSSWKITLRRLVEVKATDRPRAADKRPRPAARDRQARRDGR